MTGLPAGQRDSARTLPLALLYAGSGVTSLAFEVLWARMLSVQFGISIFGVVVTVAAFMGGLGAGSLLGMRWRRKRSRPLLVFALIETGIALYALILPWLVSVTESGLDAIAPGASLTGWYLLQGGGLLLLILAPATAMGCGFPLVLRSIDADRFALGRIYGANACGAAAGALLPLWLLPVFGWGTAVQIVAAVGLTVGLCAAALGRRIGPAGPERPPAAAAGSRIPRPTLLVYGALGAAAIMLEIGWTRLFGMVLMRTEYVLAVILAVYLVGIGGGSLIAHRLTDRRWFALLPPLAAFAALAILGLVPRVSSWLEARTFETLSAALLSEAAVLAALTLPVTLALGAWLPLLTARFGAHSQQGAVLYGANAVGAALGALLAGFVLIPVLGTTLTLAVAGLLLFLCGMAWSSHRRVWLALPFLLAATWPLAGFPPVRVMLPVTYAASRDLYRYEDAVSITHVVEQADGQRVLLTDLQRMDASSEPAAVELQKNQARLALLLHPAPRSVLFLGLGTGISAAGSLPYPGIERTAVELSQGSIVAAREWFVPVNHGVSAQMSIVRDDVRHYLRVSGQRHDVIIGDVFHPDLAGRSALLSVQQFELARARLNRDGVFVQWLALNQFDLEALRVVLRTFHHVFPRAALFMDGFRLALVGFDGELAPAARLAAVRARLGEGEDELTGGEGYWTWLGRYWGGIPPSEGPLQDEWRPVIEFHLPHARYRSKPDLVELLEWLLAGRPAVERAAAELGVGAEDFPALERAYIGTDLGLRSWVGALQGQDTEAVRLGRFAYQANPRDRWVSYALADNMYASLPGLEAAEFDRRQALRSILAVRPDHSQALRALWRLERAAGNDAAAMSYRARLREASPLDRDVAQPGG